MAGRPGRPRLPSLPDLAVFVPMWLMAGFSLGTSTLVGPARWIATAVREAGWGPSVERGLMGLVIVALVVASAAVAGWLTRVVRETGLEHLRFGIPALVFACAASAAWLWMSPETMGAVWGERVEVGSHFTFGPYPTAEKMQELKRDGFTAVVSLLHPAVVPFEPKLLADEREAARRVGLDLIHLPMLPWVSGNQEAIERVEQLARGRAGRFYVHCYLGKDRVLLVRRLVERIEAGATVGQEVPRRTLEQREKPFERGEIYRLAPQLYLTPYPTDEEFAYVIGWANLVVSLMDPADPQDREWIERERTMLERFHLPLKLLPLSSRDYDPRRVLEVARQVWTLPRPLVVHAFLSPSTGRAPTAEAFLQAFRSDLPPIPPSHFADPLAGGTVEVLAPNVAVGPRPERSEFTLLAARGVRELVYVGDPATAEPRLDRSVAKSSGLPWQAWEGEDVELLGVIARGGPWYLYDPRAGVLREAVAARLGPAIPREVTWDVAAFLKRHREEARRVPDVAREAAGDDATVGSTETGRSFLAGLPEPLLPEPKMVIVLGPILLLLCALAGGLAGWLRLDRKIPAPYTRKVFHVIVFTCAGVLHLAAGLPAVVLFGTIASVVVLYAVGRGDGFSLYEAIARPTDAPRRTLFVVVPLVTTALGGLLGNLLFAPFAYVGYLVSGWGDAVGEPVGRAWGRHRYRVPSLAGVPATRSVEGSVAVLLVGVLAAFLGLWAYGIGPGTAFAVAMACGLTGAVVEAVSHHGLDNLTIQVAASGTAFWLLS